MKKLVNLIFLTVLINSISFAQIWMTVPGTLGPLAFMVGSPTYVQTLYVYDSLLYVGGSFTQAGGNNISRSIATWNSHNWGSLGAGTDHSITVFDILHYNNDLYIVGEFDSVSMGYNNINAMNVARWNMDSLNWHSVGSGWMGSVVDDIHAVALYKGEIYVGGSFDEIDYVHADNVAKWDGTQWSDVGGGIYWSSIACMAVYKDELYVGGIFNSAIGNNITRWDGNEWKQVGEGTDGKVTTLFVDTVNDILYAGGGFLTAGGVIVSGIAKWDGNNWSDIGGGLNNGVRGITMYHNELYAVGSFTGTADGIPANNIARWDGVTWKPAGQGLNSTTEAVDVYKDTLYVGGYFTMAGNDSAFGIARWYNPPCASTKANFGTSADTVFLADSAIVHFYDSSTFTSQWFWDFGDGTTDTVQNPIHYYSNQGSYIVTLIIKYGDCSNTNYAIITVVDNTGIEKIYGKENEYLGDNIPNPFKNTTIIPYYVPQGKKGVIEIYNVKAKLLKSFSVKQGRNKLEISLADFKNGTYI